MLSRQLGRQGLELGPRPGRQAEHGATAGQLDRERPADPARGPGDQRSGARLNPHRRPEGTLNGMSHEHATVAEEEYLQTIFWLKEAGLPMTAANVARAMQLSAPTVHEMIGRLERDGYVTRGDDKRLEFTDEGLEHATGVVRRHRLIERFLTDVLGIPWDEVHEEAERLEHAMSPVLEARMLAAIGNAKTCPHGHPIEAGSRIEGVPLADVAEGAEVTVLRFENEAEDLLHYLKESGLEPGEKGRLSESGDDQVTIEFGDRSATVTRSVAETVSVLADPSPPPRTALPEQLVLARDRYGR
jgi:DtxR family Mn-dependent transcriptional regulator